jgi:hypothetical protein
MSLPAPHAVPAPRADANFVGTGLLFGLLQWSTFFLLESYLSSTALVWLLASTVWLLGSLVGLAVPDRPREPWWLALALLSYYALFSLALRHPYDLRLLPLLLGCVAGMGLYAGRFFRCRRDPPGGPRRLFLLENTGFVLGLFLTFALLYWTGLTGLSLAPLPVAAFCLATTPARAG